MIVDHINFEVTCNKSRGFSDTNTKIEYENDELYSNIQYDGLSKKKRIQFSVIFQVYLRTSFHAYEKKASDYKRIKKQSDYYPVNQVYEIDSDLSQINTGKHYCCGVEK